MYSVAYYVMEIAENGELFQFIHENLIQKLI